MCKVSAEFSRKLLIFQIDFLLKSWDCSGAKACKSCRTWKILSNAYFHANFRFDTAENEPAKIFEIFAKFQVAFLQNLQTCAVLFLPFWDSGRKDTRCPPCPVAGGLHAMLRRLPLAARFRGAGGLRASRAFCPLIGVDSDNWQVTKHKYSSVVLEYYQPLEGAVSAVSKSIFASKYACCSIFQDLQ